MQYKVTLRVTAEVPATCEIFVEAENIDAAWQTALESYEAQDAQDQRDLNDYLTKGAPYPSKRLVSWDAEPIEEHLDPRDIEVDEVKEA